MDAPLQCPFCEHANHQGANYCSNCGQRLQLKVCPECGVVNDQVTDRCYQCGTPFPATSEANASQAACERLRQILRGDAPSSDLGRAAPSAANVEQPGVEPPGAIQAAAGDQQAHPSDHEPAIARERFSSERALRFRGEAEELSQDFNLLRPIKVPLTPDFDADSAPTQRPLQPVPAPEPMDATHRPLSPALGRSLRLGSTLRGARAKWVGATVVVSIAAFAYSMYRVAATDAPGTIRGQPVAPVETSTEVTSGRLLIRNADEVAASSRTTAASSIPDADPVKVLGIAMPAATANDVVEAPAGAAASALVSTRQAQSRPRDQGASAGRPTSAMSTRVQSSPKDPAARARNAPAAAGPITCTEGVAALGLCLRDDGENK